MYESRLLIFNKTRLFVYLIDDIIIKMDNKVKRRIGFQLLEISFLLLNAINRANNSYGKPLERLRYIGLFQADLETIGVIIDMCVDKKYISLAHKAHLIELTVPMKKLSINWEKATKLEFTSTQRPKE